MGCDIHYVIEKNYNGRWIGVYSPYVTPSMRCREEDRGGQNVSSRYQRTAVFGDRNYAFFGQLAGVRSAGPEPVGLPGDISELTQAEVNSWGKDGHSHSWLSYRDFCERYRVATALIFNDTHGLEDLAGLDEEELDDYRVVFWFDN